MAAVRHLLHYISDTIHHGCKYKRGRGDEPDLVGYSDSDHGGDLDDRKSTSGSVFFLRRNLITWASQKQKIIAMSSCEAEYVAAAATAMQAVWLSRLIADIQGTEAKSVKLLVDKKSAIALSKNPVHHDRSKHIDFTTRNLLICDGFWVTVL